MERALEHFQSHLQQQSRGGGEKKDPRSTPPTTSSRKGSYGGGGGGRGGSSNAREDPLESDEILQVTHSLLSLSTNVVLVFRWRFQLAHSLLPYLEPISFITHVCTSIIPLRVNLNATAALLLLLLSIEQATDEWLRQACL